MQIDDRHRDMIIYALKAMRFEEDAAAAYGNPKAAANLAHIDSAIEELQATLAPSPNGGQVGQWQPLSDGMYYDVEVAHNGSELSMIAVDAHDLEWPTETDLPPDIRLCRRTVPQALPE